MRVPKSASVSYGEPCGPTARSDDWELTRRTLGNDRPPSDDEDKEDVGSGPPMVEDAVVVEDVDPAARGHADRRDDPC